jgi:hypothetical protein
MHTIKLFLNKQIYEAWKEALTIQSEELERYVTEYEINIVDESESTFYIEIKYRSSHVLLTLGRSLGKIEAIHKIKY